ncbi:MAG TPA: SRPBCC domain-containing protein [Bacillales bacterium]|nr:SRPBCC domain-containing protein [Bacillales bacterium]
MPEISHETYIQAPPEKVYETLTTAAGWNAWFTDGTTVDLEGDIRFRWQNFGSERKTIEDGGPVLEAVPYKKFTFQWFPGETLCTVSLKLAPYKEGTLLSIHETGYSTSDRDLSAMANCAAGWGEAMTLLKFYLERGIVCKEDLRG